MHSMLSRTMSVLLSSSSRRRHRPSNFGVPVYDTQIHRSTLGYAQKAIVRPMQTEQRAKRAQLRTYYLVQCTRTYRTGYNSSCANYLNRVDTCMFETTTDYRAMYRILN